MRQCVRTTLIAFALIAFVPVAPARAAGALTWSVGPSVSTPQFNTVDVRPAYLTDTGGFWMVYADGSNVVHRWFGGTLDRLTEQAHGSLDASFGHRYGERYWLAGAYTDLHTWYATVHVEFNYHATPAVQFNWFRKIGLATSTDRGLHWHYAGDILFSAQSPNIRDYANLRYFNDGPGDQYLFADWRGGYFYIYYTVSWVDKNTGERWEGTRAARCPLSAKLVPGCWHKYYQGGWSQPGIGGKDSDILLDQDNAAVFYDSYLGKYVAVGHSTGNVTYLTTATDLTAQNWAPLTHFTNDALLYWYNWAVDPATSDIFTIGRTFRLYSAQNNYAGVTTKYMTVTLGTSGTPNAAPARQTYPYPYTSVPDHNPGWQRTPDQPLGTVVNADFTYASSIPTGWETWPYPWQTNLYGARIVLAPSMGGAALRLDATTVQQSVEQTVDIAPNTTYTLSAWAQEADTGHPIYVGVKAYGGPETRQAIASQSYAQGHVTFTTGPGSTTARIYLWKPTGGVGYADAVTLVHR